MCSIFFYAVSDLSEIQEFKVENVLFDQFDAFLIITLVQSHLMIIKVKIDRIQVMIKIMFTSVLLKFVNRVNQIKVNNEHKKIEKLQNNVAFYRSSHDGKKL